MQLTALQEFGELDLARGEHIIYRVSPHVLSFLWHTLPAFFAMGVGVGLFLVLSFLDLSGVEAWAFVLILSGVPFLWGLYDCTRKWIDWRYDQGIVTSKRVLVLNHEFIFSREINSVEYSSIRDVNVIQKGIFRILFHFGTVEIQTSSSVSLDGVSTTKLLLADIPHPRRTQKLIDMLQGDAKAREMDPDGLLMECGLKVFPEILKGFGNRMKKVLKKVV